MKLIPNNISRPAFRSVLVFKKNSPHIFFAAGIIGVVASTVLACRATLELEDTLTDMKEELDDVRSSSTPNSRDVAYVYAKNVAKIGKLYAPAVAVGTVSIGALTGSHVAMTRRNTAITAAYAAVVKAYDEYRIRVQGEVGEERELDLYHSITTEKTKVNGVKSKVKFADEETWSPYARMFDEANANWVKDAEINQYFIRCQERYATQRLQSRGHLFLNEVYEMLGYAHTTAGSVVGWIYDAEGGDNYVDFGLYSENTAQFMDGWEPRVLIDFNVDGVVYDKIER